MVTDKASATVTAWKLYAVLMNLENNEAMQIIFESERDYTARWDDPEFLPKFLAPFVPPDGGAV